MPTSQDFCANDNNNDDKAMTDYFTPCTCVWDNDYDINALLLNFIAGNGLLAAHHRNPPCPTQPKLWTSTLQF